MENKIGVVTDANIVSSDRRARVSGGLYITFETPNNMVKDNVISIVVDDKTKTFQVTSVSIKGENLLVEAKEYGYWANKLSRDKNLDLRRLINLEVFSITDEARLKELYTQSCWC